MSNNNPTTRERVLALLLAHNSNFISGQEIADTLFLTRAGIWKAIKTLRESGYNIEAVTNKGYRLIMEKDVLSAEVIQSALESAGIPLRVIVLDEVGSTNDIAKEYAASSSENYLIIAKSQSGGHGRKGRVFYSPKGCGLYFSLLLHPRIDFSRATYLTCMAAVAVCRAIEQVQSEIEARPGSSTHTQARQQTGVLQQPGVLQQSGIQQQSDALQQSDGTVHPGSSLRFEPKIKWVNDIFMNDRKVCGILTEGYTSIEDGSLSYVIVGMGMNLYMPGDGFPKEIKNVAGVIFPEGENEENVKNRLCTAIVTEFMRFYQKGDTPQLIDEYRRRSMLIGHYVKILSDSASPCYGKVEGIDDACHLLIRLDNGELKELSSGEVSVVKY